MDSEKTFNKNDRQFLFNKIKGILSEKNDGDRFCNITLKCGHENVREINLVAKKELYDQVCQDKSIGDKVCVKFYLSSKRRKEGGWYTIANILTVENV